MNDMCEYHIRVRGRVDEAEINAMSPIQLVREQGETTLSQFAARTDQSGLIGLLRHLHDRGFLLLSFQRGKEATGRDTA